METNTGAVVETGASPEQSTDTVTGQDAGQTAERTYSQSELDSLVRKAVESNMAKHQTKLDEERKAIEHEKLREQNKYKELYEKLEGEKRIAQLNAETERYLREKNVGDFADVFASDFSSIDGRKSVADRLSQIVESVVEKRIAERLKTPAPVSTTNPQPAIDKDPGDMNADELKAYSEAKGLNKLGFVARPIKTAQTITR